MSGVEAAGLVLGAIPLILASLEFYAKGIAVSKRYLRFGQAFKSLLTELRAENVILTNTLNLLLKGIVKQQDMAEFLAEPSGERCTYLSSKGEWHLWVRKCCRRHCPQIFQDQLY
jgi:hypothetical protein